MSVNDMNDAESLSVKQSQHGSQRILRASIEMPVLSAVTNIGLSTSEEGLAVNGNAQTGDQTQSSQVEEQRVFVFVEKQPGESLGLYLVPFEEEPLTGLFVKTVVPGKSAARLQVFDPGDKIVTVNGKPLAGLSYREANDFIRQCSGPNVKMGIIKHAIYKQEDLEKLDSMSAYRHSANIDGEFNVGGALSLGQTSDVDTHPTAFRLSGCTPKNDVPGGTVVDGATKLAIEAPVTVQKSDASYNVESMPDCPQGNLEDNLPKLGYDIELSGGLGGQAVDTNANMGGKLPGTGSGMDVDIDGQNGVDTDISFPAGGTSGKAEVKFPDTSSSSEAKVHGIDLEAPKDSKFSLKRYFSGSKSKVARVSSSDESSLDYMPESEYQVNKMTFILPKFRFGSLKKSKQRSSKKGKGGDQGTTEVELPSVEIGGSVQKPTVDAKLKNRPPSAHDSGSETSDSEGGRTNRKFKLPKFGFGMGGGASGKIKGSKPDDDSGSETSDGEGGKIKRKLKRPKLAVAEVSGKVKGSKSDDSSDNDNSQKRNMKFILPKFGFGSKKKAKDTSPKKGKDLDIDVSGGDKKGIEIPSVELEGDVKKTSLDAQLKNRRPSADNSDSETSDGEGGRIKRKLKGPKFGIGCGISGGATVSKPEGDSGSETSDGEGGRIKRSLKMKMPKFGIEGGISGKAKSSTSGSDGNSETSDGEGGRIKRKLKVKRLKVDAGISGKAKGSKSRSDSDSDSDASDGKGGRIKRKLKAPKFGVNAGIGGGCVTGDKVSKQDASSSETSDGKGGRIKRKLKVPSGGATADVNLNVAKSKSESSDSSDDDGNKKRMKFKYPKFRFGGRKSKSKKIKE